MITSATLAAGSRFTSHAVLIVVIGAIAGLLMAGIVDEWASRRGARVRRDAWRAVTWIGTAIALIGLGYQLGRLR